VFKRCIIPSLLFKAGHEWQPGCKPKGSSSAAGTGLPLHRATEIPGRVLAIDEAEDEQVLSEYLK
jgi:hypothetical protein